MEVALRWATRSPGDDAGFDLRSSNFDFYDTVRKTFVANDDLKGSADEIGIIEFDAGAIGTIIPQYFDACRHQIGIETCGSLGSLFRLADRQEVDMEGRDGKRPDDALLIVMLSIAAAAVRPTPMP